MRTHAAPPHSPYGIRRYAIRPTLRRLPVSRSPGAYGRTHAKPPHPMPNPTALHRWLVGGVRGVHSMQSCDASLDRGSATALFKAPWPYFPPRSQSGPSSMLPGVLVSRLAGETANLSCLVQSLHPTRPTSVCCVAGETAFPLILSHLGVGIGLSPTTRVHLSAAVGGF